MSLLQNECKDFINTAFFRDSEINKQSAIIFCCILLTHSLIFNLSRNLRKEMFTTCCIHLAKAISAVRCKTKFNRIQICTVEIVRLLQHIAQEKRKMQRRISVLPEYIYKIYSPCLCSVWTLIQGVNTGYIVRYPTATSFKYCVSSSLIVHTRLPWPS